MEIDVNFPWQSFYDYRIDCTIYSMTTDCGFYEIRVKGDDTGRRYGELFFHPEGIIPALFTNEGDFECIKRGEFEDLKSHADMHYVMDKLSREIVT
jgi:hypothetical protein